MPSAQNVTIFLPQFDPLSDMTLETTYLGGTSPSPGATLTSVEISISTFISGANVQLDNDSNQPQDGTGLVTSVVNSLTVPDNDVVNPFLLQISEGQLFNLEATSGDAFGFTNTGNTDYANWSPGVLTGNSGGVNGSGFNPTYIGTADLEFTIKSTYTAGATFSGNDGYFQGNTPSGQFQAEITYTYETSAIPEPSSALLGVFGGMLALMRRRRC